MRGKPTRLYNLEIDIGEKKNVIESNPEVVKKLAMHLNEFSRDIAEKQ